MGPDGALRAAADARNLAAVATSLHVTTVRPVRQARRDGKACVRRGGVRDSNTRLGSAAGCDAERNDDRAVLVRREHEVAAAAAAAAPARDPSSRQAPLCSAPTQGSKQALPLQWLQMLSVLILQCVEGLPGADSAERQQAEQHCPRATLVARGGAEAGRRRGHAKARCCVCLVCRYECVRAGAASHACVEVN